MLKRTLLTALILLCACVCSAEDQLVDRFNGTWTVEFDRTMEEVQKSPKYTPGDAEKMPAMITQMMEKMKIKITGNELVYARGAKEAAFPYTLEASTDISVTLKVTQMEQEVTFTLTLIDGKYMNLNSSASDDMDYYIWTKE